jgi:hypothetical protein
VKADFNASAISAGALISTNKFEVPPFQREYAWTEEEYEDFWQDIRRSLSDRSYFLGLVILTSDDGGRKVVVDGQQRLLTITLLASALLREAVANNREALADRIRSDFLETIDYQTDELSPRIVLSDRDDNETLQRIVRGGSPNTPDAAVGSGISPVMSRAFVYLSEKLRADLAPDPFRRLGLWTEFLSNRLQFAVFIHPDAASAYRVYEVINTRGREPTTADLLKNHVLSQTPEAQHDVTYARWQSVSRPLALAGPNTLVQYIRHVVTVWAGHVPPKELFDYLTQRKQRAVAPPPASALLTLMEDNLDLYLQMIDPTAAGPASPDALAVFGALNDLGVIAVRPLLLAMSVAPDTVAGNERVLNLVVRRVVARSLGTGNVERRLGDAALAVRRDRRWEVALDSLRDLDPHRDEFESQLARRSPSKDTLQFVRRTVIQATKTPQREGWLHFIRPRQGGNWPGFVDEDHADWGSTLGNSVLVSSDRRPAGASTWRGVKENLLPLAVPNEWTHRIAAYEEWTAESAQELGRDMARAAADIWY